MRKFCISLALSLFFVTLSWAPDKAQAATTLAQRLSGRILFQVQTQGRIWYISPLNLQRYFLKDEPSTFILLKSISVPMSIEKLNLIPLTGSTDAGNAAFRQRFSGRIVRQTGTTTMWYVSPLNRQRYALGDQPRTVLKKLALGISNTNINTIPVAPGFNVPPAPVRPVNGLIRVQQAVDSSRGRFTVDIMTLDTTTTTLKIMTDTSLTTDCRNGCKTIALKTFVDRRSATAGIHGTYFCPLEYASCVGQTGSYLYPVYNSFSRVMINGSRIKFTTQPLVAIDNNNVPHYYHQAKDFLSQTTFEASAEAKLQAAISNGPAMIEAGQNVLKTGQLDTKQATVKSYRGAFGWKEKKLFFMIVRGATIIDSAAVMQALGLDYAINLDGGGSTALYKNGAYTIGPGRNLPNAILLVP